MHAIYLSLGIATPHVHVVLGSGYGQALEDVGNQSDWKECGKISFGEVPGLGAASVPGHPGVFRFFKHTPTGEVVTFQVGRLHGYEGYPATKVVQPVMNAVLSGTKKFILTNAAGGLNPKFDVGSVMMIRDHVNMTGVNPLVGPNPAYGPRFPDLSNAWNKDLSSRLQGAFESRKELKVHHGVYLGVMGPSFETPAEVRLFNQWGMGAVGMSTVWEAIALNHAGAQVAGVSLISNYACGLVTSGGLNHEEILETSRKSARAVVAGILDFCAIEVGSATRV